MLGEHEELGARVGVDDTTSHVEHWALGGSDAGRRLADLTRMTSSRRPPAGEIDRVRIFEVELGLLDVTGNVDEHRTATAGTCDVERSLDHVGQLFHVFDEPRMLDDRDRDSRDVALLKGVSPDQMRPHLTGDADEGSRVHPRVCDRRDEIGRAGPRRRDRDADAPGRARVTLRHVTCALLVACEDVADGRATCEGVVGRQDRSARDSEDDLDAFGLEGAKQGIGTVHPHASSR